MNVSPRSIRNHSRWLIALFVSGLRPWLWWRTRKREWPVATLKLSFAPVSKPAGSMPLLLIHFMQQRECPAAADVGTRGDKRIHQSHRRDVRHSKGQRLDRCNE